MATPHAGSSRLRRVAATAGVLTAIAGVVMIFGGVGLAPTELVALGALGASAFLLRARSFGAQLASRAIWSTFAVVSMALLASGDRAASGTLLLGSAVALVAAGTKGLREEDAGEFRPAKYRTALVLSLILSATSAMTFALFSTLTYQVVGAWTLNLGTILALTTGVVALSRMKTWGLLLLGAANGWIVAQAAGGALALPSLLQGWVSLLGAAGLIGLGPLLGAAAAHVFRGNGSRPERVRVAAAVVGQAAPVGRELGRELAAEEELEASAERAQRIARPGPSRAWRASRPR